MTRRTLTVQAPDDFSSAAQWADAYRALGLAVIPARGQEKIPLGKWQEFQNGIPQAVHDRWYGESGDNRSNYRMGFLTGAASIGDGWKLLLIDLDEKGAVSGSGTWDQWIGENELGCDPETWRARTGGGGQHIYFKYPAHLHIRNTQETIAGIDVRAEGGFVITPPSRHVSGKQYAWLYSPFETDLAEAPGWLLEKVGASEAPFKTTTAPKDRLTLPEQATDAWGHIVDGRDAYMRDLVWASVVDWYRECPIPPGDAESERKMLEAFATYERKVRPQDPSLTLEGESRGISAFRAKWAYAMRQWDGKVSEAAKRPGAIKQPAYDFSVSHGAPSSSLDLVATPFKWIDPALIPPRRFIYGRHYIRQFVSTTVAPGGVGKSSLGIVEALSIASGKPLLGVTPGERGRVWLFNGEDPVEELQRRIMASTLLYRLSESDVSGNLFMDSGRDTPIVIAEQTRDGAKILTPIVEAITKTIRDNQIDVLIVDPFVSSHRVSENDNNAIERVAKTWATIAGATNCSIDLVHHSRKTGGGEVTVEDGRGASALLSAARSARVLNQMTQEEGEKAGVENHRLFFRVDNGKANLAPPTSAAEWYHLKSVPLGNGEMSKSFGVNVGEGDSVGVVSPWSWPDPFSDIRLEDLRRVQQAVSSGGPWRENSQANNWVGIPVASALKLDPKNKANIRKIVALMDMWLRSGAFVRVTGKDAKRMEKMFIEVGEWA